MFSLLGQRPYLSRGSVLVMTLVFVTMFVVTFLALSGYVNRTYKQAVLQSQDEVAFQVAEAGLNFARWRLAHAPSNFSTVTQSVTDQYAGVLGEYTVTFTAPAAGNSTVVIASVGKSSARPERTATLSARYGIPSLAQYSYVTNSDVYFASQIHGLFHANGGIRMDGQSDSEVHSAKLTYTCKPVHGCNPAQSKAGIWGTGQIQALWKTQVPKVDYPALSSNLSAMQLAAIASNTYYDASNVFGYQIVFNPNNTYSIYKVTSKANAVQSCDYDTNDNYTCANLTHDVQSQTFLETKAVPANGVIFTEDHTWVRGDIRSRVTLAAANFPLDDSATNVDMIINGNISYGGVEDGTRAFGAVAQRHLLIPYSGAPNNLILDGAYLSQNGKFGRRNYTSGPHRLKSSIDIFGMIGSFQIPGTTWSSGGSVVSGYQSKVQTYDPNLLYGPPPYFPTSGQYEFISWEQQ